MSKKQKKIGELLLDIVANIAASWISVCMLYKLITMCFEIPFTLRIATGVWLCTCLISITVKDTKK